MNQKISASLMREAIQNIAVGPNRGRNISRTEAAGVLRGVLAGDIDEVQIGVFLIALRMKRESIEEFLGLFDALLEYSKPVTADVDEVWCLADPFDGYSRTATITPFIPPVLAACGLPSVIHGVESIGPKHGVTAHKVYRSAGINTDLTSAETASGLTAAGWGYCDQSRYAKPLNKLSSVRDKIVKRTALTTLERLLMPIKGKRSTHMVLGYVHNAYPSIYSRVAVECGYDSVLLLKGVEGGLAPALNKPLRRFFFDGELPSDIDVQKEIIGSQNIFNRPVAAAGLEGTSSPVDYCLEQGVAVLGGSSGVARDSLCLSAGQVLFAHGRAPTLEAAVENVQYCLDNGVALERFNALINNAL